MKFSLGQVCEQSGNHMAYIINEKIKAGLRLLQAETHKIYRTREPKESFVMAKEECAKLERAFEENSKSRIKGHLAELLLRFVSLCNSVGVRVEDIIEDRVNAHIKEYHKDGKPYHDAVRPITFPEAKVRFKKETEPAQSSEYDEPYV